MQRFRGCKNLIFSEPPVDTVSEEVPSVQMALYSLLNMCQVNTINVPTVQSNVFLCSPYIWPHRSLCSRIRYRRYFHKRTGKMPSKHTTLTLLIPAKRVLMLPNTLALDLEDPKPVATIDGFTDNERYLI